MSVGSNFGGFVQACWYQLNVTDFMRRLYMRISTTLQVSAIFHWWHSVNGASTTVLAQCSYWVTAHVCDEDYTASVMEEVHSTLQKNSEKFRYALVRWILIIWIFSLTWRNVRCLLVQIMPSDHLGKSKATMAMSYESIMCSNMVSRSPTWKCVTTFATGQVLASCLPKNMVWASLSGLNHFEATINWWRLSQESDDTWNQNCISDPW